MDKTSKLKKLAGRLLATTCLTVATAAIASASPYTGPYGHTFGTATDVGLDTPVTGTLAGPGEDYFEFEGLTASDTLSSILTIVNTGGIRDMQVTLFTSTGTTIMSGEIVDPGDTASLTGSVPGNGDVVVEIRTFEEPGTSFSATLSSAVPEPATLSVVGLGLLGLGALRRRRSTKQ